MSNSSISKAPTTKLQTNKDDCKQKKDHKKKQTNITKQNKTKQNKNKTKQKQKQKKNETKTKQTNIILMKKSKILKFNFKTDKKLLSQKKPTSIMFCATGGGTLSTSESSGKSSKVNSVLIATSVKEVNLPRYCVSSSAAGRLCRTSRRKASQAF